MPGPSPRRSGFGRAGGTSPESRVSNRLAANDTSSYRRFHHRKRESGYAAPYSLRATPPANIPPSITSSVPVT
jgi:hypothetical protein